MSGAQGEPEHRFPQREQCVLAEVLERRADEHGDRTYLLFGDVDRTWSYRETARSAWQMGHALASAGVEMQQCVAVWTPTGPDLIRAWLGAAAIGAIYAPINLDARGQFLQHLLNLCEAPVLVAHAGLVERLVGLDLPSLRTVVVVGDGDVPELPWPTVRIDPFVAQSPAYRPTTPRPIEPWDDVSLIFTSGTTGPSKGVRAAYAQQWFFDQCLLWSDVGPDDRLLQSLPMFHNAGMTGTSGMLLRGGSVALVDGFRPRDFLADVRRLGATTTTLIAAMVQFLLAQPAQPDDADNPLRVAYMGPLSHVEEFTARFGVSVFTSFGMTEAPCPLRTGLNPTDPTSCGRPVSPEHYEVRVVDEHDLPVPPGTPGELVLRHAQPWFVNSGYRNMPEATAEAWRNGWFHTGDCFVVDERGEYHFVERMKDAIRRRGESVSAHEVEEGVLQHPDVLEVAAVAVDNPDVAQATRDQEVKIVVVRKPGSTLGHEQLLRFLVAELPRHYVPRFIEFVDELPRTPTFKVKKADLRAVGITDRTWDREDVGIRLKRESLV